MEINYLLAIIRFVFKYKEETEKAYLIQLPANVVCFCERTMERTQSHIPMMGLTKCQECWTFKTLKEQKEFEDDAFNQSTKSGKRFSENVLLINWIIKLVTVDQTGFFLFQMKPQKIIFDCLFRPLGV